MTWLSNFITSSVGRKQLMALTGLGLSGFLITHLSGNFLIYVGEDAFNGYAAWLGGQPFLPLARIGLLGIAVLHIVLALNLTHTNDTARPTPYFYKAPSDASLASRSMILTGLLILIYVVIHLFNFTWDHPTGEGGLYGLVVAKLSNPLYSLFYLTSMVILCVHLLHGIQSAFQTFGINHSKYTPHIKKACMALAVAVCLGFASIPLYLLIKGGA